MSFFIWSMLGQTKRVSFCTVAFCRAMKLCTAYVGNISASLISTRDECGNVQHLIADRKKGQGTITANLSWIRLVPSCSMLSCPLRFQCQGQRVGGMSPAKVMCFVQFCRCLSGSRYLKMCETYFEQPARAPSLARAFCFGASLHASRFARK